MCFKTLYLIEFDARHEWYEYDLERALNAVKELSQSNHKVKLSELKEKVYKDFTVEKEVIRTIPLQ